MYAHIQGPTTTRFMLMVVGIAMFGLTGCKSYDVIPKDLETQVASGLTYELVQTAPEDHQGKVVVWGGEVLAGKRTAEGTRLEILHLPLSDDLYPTEQRALSKGRFVAYDDEGVITDPAAVEPGTAVTIIGRIGPLQTEELQGVEYHYPRLNVLDMTVWEKKRMRNWRYLGGWGWRYDPRPRTLYRSYRID
ncbi:MAG: Slp family lipoprotein [Nitrospira sp.]|nr:Slp family lipoprotein [Nitrospira sp.]